MMFGNSEKNVNICIALFIYSLKYFKRITPNFTCKNVVNPNYVKRFYRELYIGGKNLFINNLFLDFHV